MGASSQPTSTVHEGTSEIPISVAVENVFQPALDIATEDISEIGHDEPSLTPLIPHFNWCIGLELARVLRDCPLKI